jgi:hypothetical protein
MSSLYPVTFTWTGTPTGMADISTNGPVGVPFGCTPIDEYQYFTFAFSQFGNGCPREYSYNPLSTTCVYTADLYNSQTWGCTWTVADVSTSVVDGGPTSLPAGIPATVTAPIQWVTVTSTQQITSTSTSIVDPGAVTVTVSATQGASKLRRGESPRNEARSGEDKVLGEILEKPLNEPENDLVLAAFTSTKGANSTDLWLEDRALCPYTDQIYCGAGCCTSPQGAECLDIKFLRGYADRFQALTRRVVLEMDRFRVVTDLIAFHSMPTLHLLTICTGHGTALQRLQHPLLQRQPIQQ